MIASTPGSIGNASPDSAFPRPAFNAVARGNEGPIGASGPEF